MIPKDHLARCMFLSVCDHIRIREIGHQKLTDIHLETVIIDDG